MPAKTRAAQVWAHNEGFGKPGAIPTVRHNPGDLRHSPHSSHAGEGSNDIGIIDSDADGWADLERQLQLFADRGLTIREAAETYWPEPENNTAACLQTVCEWLGLGPDVKMSVALMIPAEEPHASN